VPCRGISLRNRPIKLLSDDSAAYDALWVALSVALYWSGMQLLRDKDLELSAIEALEAKREAA
jgi:hypothetical protein